MNIIKKSRNKHLCYAALLLYLLAVYIVSGLHLQSTPFPFSYKDKIEHFIEYFVMGILLFRFFYHGRKMGLKKAVLSGVIFGLVFGISDELHQGMVGYFDSGIFGGVRDCSLYDYLADATGILAAAIFYLKISRNSAKKREHLLKEQTENG